MSDKIKIVEVGARDGLQNEAATLSVDDRILFLKKLVDTGLQYLEGGSFVSPKAIPQMVDSEKVWEGVKNIAADFSFLVANQKGLDRTFEAGVKSISVFTATSDSFTQKNIGMSVSESLATFAPIVSQAKAKKLSVRGYISTVFGCPYEGSQSSDKAVDLVKKLFQMGCEEVSVGDTIGVAHPKQVKEVFQKLKGECGLQYLAGHFHDTRGAALANIQAAADLGVKIFDSSVGGLGGCPYAKGASGNVATEEVVWLLEGAGFKTGVSIEKLLQTAEWIEAKIGRSLKSKLYLSKPKTLFY